MRDLGSPWQRKILYPINLFFKIRDLRKTFSPLFLCTPPPKKSLKRKGQCLSPPCSFFNLSCESRPPALLFFVHCCKVPLASFKQNQLLDIFFSTKTFVHLLLVLLTLFNADPRPIAMFGVLLRRFRSGLRCPFSLAKQSKASTIACVPSSRGSFRHQSDPYLSSITLPLHLDKFISPSMMSSIFLQNADQATFSPSLLDTVLSKLYHSSVELHASPCHGHTVASLTRLFQLWLVPVSYPSIPIGFAAFDSLPCKAMGPRHSTLASSSLLLLPQTTHNTTSASLKLNCWCLSSLLRPRY